MSKNVNYPPMTEDAKGRLLGTNFKSPLEDMYSEIFNDYPEIPE